MQWFLVGFVSGSFELKKRKKRKKKASGSIQMILYKQKYGVVKHLQWKVNGANFGAFKNRKVI